MNLPFSRAEAVSTASPRERGLEYGFVLYLLAGCYTCSSNPGRPLASSLSGCGVTGALLHGKPRRITGRFVGITATSLCKARKQPSPPSSSRLKSANPSPVQQTAISIWMEHVACSGGCGCSNWYVWESEIDGDKDGESGGRRETA